MTPPAHGGWQHPLHALERVLGIDAAARTERFWLVPALVLIGTIVAFLIIGQVTAAPLYISLPNGAVIALVMAGLAVACISPPASDSPHDDPPQDRDDSPILGSPGGPWTVVAHLGARSLVTTPPVVRAISPWSPVNGAQNCGLNTITKTTATTRTPRKMPMPRARASAAR